MLSVTFLPEDLLKQPFRDLNRVRRRTLADLVAADEQLDPPSIVPAHVLPDPAAVGAILTGMGADGAAGLLNMRKAGARTIAQDESSCVVFGMPMEAIKLGGAEKIVPLTQVTQTMIAMAQGKALAA